MPTAKTSDDQPCSALEKRGAAEGVGFRKGNIKPLLYGLQSCSGWIDILQSLTCRDLKRSLCGWRDVRHLFQNAEGACCFWS